MGKLSAVLQDAVLVPWVHQAGGPPDRKQTRVKRDPVTYVDAYSILNRAGSHRVFEEITEHLIRLGLSFVVSESWGKEEFLLSIFLWFSPVVIIIMANID